MNKIKECDILIIGGGGSGALASLEASKHENLKIILASKGPIGQSGLTPTGNGGTKAVGSADELFQDMITGGRFLSDQDIVWFMVNEIQNSLERLKQFGIPITPTRGKSVCVPSTETLKKLRKMITKTDNIELLEDVLITRLLKSNGTVSGATALDLTTGEFFVIKATTVVIATGGYTGELYPHTSNNPFGISSDSSGTGQVMAYFAGAELIDMEMIQFIPLPANPRCLYLRYFPDFWAGPYENRFGEVIESNISTYQGESYSYLFVQKLFRELEKGSGPIYIDQRNLKSPDPTLMIKAWEQRRKLIKSLGIDPHQMKIEIILGSHFGMGGIKVNKKTETTIPSLYAAGEGVGGVQGGMRISGYSFTQMIVFGFEAGRQAAIYALEGRRPRGFSTFDIDQERESILRFLKPKQEPLSVIELKKRLQQVMQDHVFIIRDQSGLLEAMDKMRAIRADISRIQVPNFKRFNLEWVRAIEFSLMIELAELIVKSALAREESRGFHHRRDFPEEDNEKWLKHTLVKWEKGHPKVGSTPVVLDRLKPVAGKCPASPTL
jgi:succinate dehydrogenase/fumarate reductase flavoprotein subunit